ncbi:MAG: TetR/AcrR family transcriptional regulator [Chthoniobacteraceae bacterium]
MRPKSPTSLHPRAANTKDLLIDTAERLFATHSVEAVSIRDITTEADVNLAAINYHFGSKIELVKAVFLRRLIPVDQRRVELLDELGRRYGKKPPKLEDVLWILIYPILEQGMSNSQNRTFFQLMNRIFSETNEEIRNLVHEQSKEMKARMDAAFLRAMPNLSVEDLHWTISFVMGAIDSGLMFLSVKNRFREETSPDGTVEPSMEELTQRLITFAAGGLKSSLQKFKK